MEVNRVKTLICVLLLVSAEALLILSWTPVQFRLKSGDCGEILSISSPGAHSIYNVKIARTLPSASVLSLIVL
jgi:hypothetical protein